MPSNNQHKAESPQSQDQNNAMPDDRRDNRLENKPGAGGEASVEKAPLQDDRNQATIAEFDEEGMGVAPKE